MSNHYSLYSTTLQYLSYSHYLAYDCLVSICLIYCIVILEPLPLFNHVSPLLPLLFLYSLLFFFPLSIFMFLCCSKPWISGVFSAYMGSSPSTNGSKRRGLNPLLHRRGLPILSSTQVGPACWRGIGFISRVGRGLFLSCLFRTGQKFKKKKIGFRFVDVAKFSNYALHICK